MILLSNRKSKFLVLLLAFVCFQTAKSQDTLAQGELENLLTKAERQSQNYGRVFQNLSAEETKIKFRFKSDGSLDERRVIKSLFVVYQSPNTDNAQEFRNVVEYNGKNVSRSDRETAAFFKKLAGADTSQEEFAKIRKESLRYDGNRVSWGMTLYQPRPFSANLLANFKFRVVGKERIENRDVWIIEYEQTKSSPYILSNPTEKEEQANGATQYNRVLPDALRPTNPLLKGKIWLDAETGQIWRNRFTLVLHPARLTQPIEAGEHLYEYQSSRFGILTPKKFVIRTVQIKGANDRDLIVFKDAEVIYEYANFSEFVTETKDYKIGK